MSPEIPQPEAPAPAPVPEVVEHPTPPEWPDEATKESEAAFNKISNLQPLVSSAKANELLPEHASPEKQLQTV